VRRSICICTWDGHLRHDVCDGRVPEDAPALGRVLVTGKEHDAVACVDVSHVRKPRSRERTHRHRVVAVEPACAGDVEALERAGGHLVLTGGPHPYGRCHEVRDVRARQRRGEPAVEAPELGAADQPPVPPRERHGRHRGARRDAGEDVAHDVVAQDCCGIGSRAPAPSLLRVWRACRRLLSSVSRSPALFFPIVSYRIVSYLGRARSLLFICETPTAFVIGKIYLLLHFVFRKKK